MRIQRARRQWLAPALSAVVGFGCGGEEVPLQGATELLQDPARRIVGAVAAGPKNLPPVIEFVRLEPAEPTAGATVVAKVKSSDPDGDRLRYAFRWRLEGERVPSSGPRVELPRSERGDLLELVVIASDDLSESVPYRISTRIVNRAPRLLGIQVEPAEHVTPGIEISVTPSGDDPDGDALRYRYRWTVNGQRTGTSGPTLETGSLRRGDAIQVWAVANDGEVDSDPIQSRAIDVVNAPPRIVSVPGKTGSGGRFRYEVAAEDPDRDRSLRYRLENAPEGMTVEVLSGVITWQPVESQSGTHAVQVIVDDLQGGVAEQTFEVSVGIPEAPVPASPDTGEDLGDGSDRLPSRGRRIP
jgi:hypothetical protein